MTTYIKTLNGKFAGSIGDGKNRIPQAANILLPNRTHVTVEPTGATAVETMYGRFAARPEPQPTPVPAPKPEPQDPHPYGPLAHQ
jgi:hypothetical protein